MPATRPRELRGRGLQWLASYKSAIVKVAEYGPIKGRANTQVSERACARVEEPYEDPSLWKKVFAFPKGTCEANQPVGQQTLEQMMPLAEAKIWVTNHVRKEALEREFQELAAKWHQETWYCSSVVDMALNPNYQSIIGMGQPVVALILRELEKGPDHWFWALSAITRENPIKEEDAGDLEKMTEAWLRLGKERGWI